MSADAAERSPFAPIAATSLDPGLLASRPGFSITVQVVPAGGRKLAGFAVRDEGHPPVRGDHADAAAAESRRRLDARGERGKQKRIPPRPPRPPLPCSPARLRQPS